MVNTLANTDMRERQGVFKYEVFSSGDWSVCIYADPDTGGKFKASGNDLPKKKNIPYELIGEWVDYKGQKTLKVSTWMEGVPSGESAIVAYLMSLKCGIGKGSAKKLYATFGEDVLTKCSEEPKKIKEIAKLCNLKKMEKRLSETHELRKLVSELGASAPITVLKKAVKRFGKNTYNRVLTNPYVLTSVKGVSFERCDEIAHHFGLELTSRSRVNAALWHVCTEEASRNGNIYWPKEEAIRRTLLFLRKLSPGREGVVFEDTSLWEHNIELCIQSFVKKGQLIEDGTALYAKPAFEEEKELARSIHGLLRVEMPSLAPSELEEAIREFEKDNNLELSERQVAAVKKAVTSSLSIITGGAGTGKTTVVRCILYCLEQMPEEDSIQLLAPTGRAARRMTEVTHRAAQTIHKALGLGIKEEGDDEYSVEYQCEPLDFSTVIVDEASMVDQYLANILLKKVGLARVIFIGDSNQLPSVGAGNVLRELIHSGFVPCTELDTIYRQGELSPIVRNSLAVNRGETELEFSRSFQLHEFASAATIRKEVVNFYLRCVKYYGVDNVVLLNPNRKGNLTVDMLNRDIQAILNPPAPPSPYPTSMKVHDVEFRIHDRVMQMKNQPDGVSNGDVGEIIFVGYSEKEEREGQLVLKVDFGDFVKEYTSAEAEDLTLAYATTVHKSQGSEYKVVILIMYHEAGRLLQRNLLYTGITRAKENIAIFGELESIKQAIENNSVIRRNTKLASRIKECCSKSV